MNCFCKVTALNQIGYLESLQVKKGYRFHFSLFFQRGLSDRKLLLDKGNLILFSKDGLIDAGNSENITKNYKKLSFRKFTDEVAKAL